jgi:hypothetical protein
MMSPSEFTTRSAENTEHVNELFRRLKVRFADPRETEAEVLMSRDFDREVWEGLANRARDEGLSLPRFRGHLVYAASAPSRKSASASFGVL